jgi:hypothetical protein
MVAGMSKETCAYVKQIVSFETTNKKHLSNEAAELAIRGFIVSFSSIRLRAPDQPRHISGISARDFPKPQSDLSRQGSCKRPESKAHCAASIVSANLISFNRVSEPHCVFLHQIDAGSSGS